MACHLAAYVVKNTLIIMMLFGLVLAGGAGATDRHPLFQSDAVLKAVLTAPISQAYAQRHQDVRIYFPGQWTYIDADGQTQRLEVAIRTRGHLRREICTRPPLQLNFKKSEVKGTLFAGQNKLKLVAPCKYGKSYQQFVVLEYLAYRTLEILTDHSFATRLVRLSYVDRDDKLDPWTSIGFLIEDDSDMADRLGLDRVKVRSVDYVALDHAKTAVVQLFQLLIANHDYSLLRPHRDDDCCHNVSVLGSEDSETGRIPVPFDFDMSGLVNAGYAAPPSPVPIRHVRTRYFYGLCQPRDVFDDAILHVQSKREEILALFRDSAELDDRIRQKSVDYIEEFYEILASPERKLEEIDERCRGQELLDQMLEAAKGQTLDLEFQSGRQLP